MVLWAKFLINKLKYVEFASGTLYLLQQIHSSFFFLFRLRRKPRLVSLQCITVGTLALCNLFRLGNIYTRMQQCMPMQFGNFVVVLVMAQAVPNLPTYTPNRVNSPYLI